MKRIVQIVTCLLGAAIQVQAARVICIGLNNPENYKPLKHAENDAALVAEMLNAQGHATVLLTGAEATREKVLEALQGEKAVVYFAGHGEKDHLVLADGKLMLAELSERAAMMLLDCCYVGGGLRKSGGTTVFAAAQHEAFESDGHGLFTKYLLKWFGGGRSFADEGLAPFVGKGIREETGGWQKPVLGYT